MCGLGSEEVLQPFLATAANSGLHFQACDTLFFIYSWHQCAAGPLRGLSLESGCSEDNHGRTFSSLTYEKCVPLLCRKAQEDGPRNYWKSAICLLSFNLTRVNLPCAMDTIRGCDFREGTVHLVYANDALKEDVWLTVFSRHRVQQTGWKLVTYQLGYKRSLYLIQSILSK